MDARVTAHQEGDQRTLQKLIRRIRAGLSIDNKRQAEESGRTIDSLLLLYLSLVREAWVHIRGWYIDAANRPLPPACVSMETLTAECAELYDHVLPPGTFIPI